MEQVTRQNTATADFLQKRIKTYAQRVQMQIILFTKEAWW